MICPQLLAALSYASRGWLVIPLHWPTALGCSCRVQGCPAAGKHPLFGRWESYASGSSAQLRAWWAQCPEANVGLAVGASGLAVLDLDDPEGFASLQALEQEHGRLPPTLRFRTGSGGAHLVFHAAGQRVPCRGHLRPKLDVRGEGGLIVAPPSLHKSGRRYEIWGQPREPAELPAWMAKLIRTSPRPAAPRPWRPPSATPKVGYRGLGDPKDLAAAIWRKLRGGGAR